MRILNITKLEWSTNSQIPFSFIYFSNPLFPLFTTLNNRKVRNTFQILGVDGH